MGYWALIACGLLFFLAGMTKIMGGYRIPGLPDASALLAFGVLGVAVASLSVLYRNRRK